LHEQNRGMRVLLRRLIAGQEVTIRPEDEPAPPAAPGPSRPRVAPVCSLHCFALSIPCLCHVLTSFLVCLMMQPPVVRKRPHDGAGGPGDTTVRLGRSKPAAAGLAEERPRRSTRRRVEIAPAEVVETSSSDDSISDANYPSTRLERQEQRRGEETESSDETIDE
jgi:hypothetical protein